MSIRFTLFSMGLWVALGAMLLTSACAPQSQRANSWNNITANAQVAKVNNIKSLITPGFK